VVGKDVRIVRTLKTWVLREIKDSSLETVVSVTQCGVVNRGVGVVRD
jgi:hypothetical protein